MTVTALLWAGVGSAAEVPSVRVLGGDGRWIEGGLLGIEGTVWTLGPLRDSSDNRPGIQEVAIDDPIACLVAVDGWSAWTSDGRVSSGERFPTGVLRLADGQRLPGVLEAHDDGAQWNHRWIGKLPIDLDRIASISLAGGVAPGRSPDADHVMLSNGDTITGFVESIGVQVRVDALSAEATKDRAPGEPAEGGDREDRTEEGADRDAGDSDGADLRAIDLDRIASIALADTGVPGAPPPSTWTRDGSVIHFRSLAIDGEGGWSFTLADPFLASVRPSDTGDNMAADPVGIVLDSRRFRPLWRLGQLEVSECMEAAGSRGDESGFRVMESRRPDLDRLDDHILGAAPIEINGPGAIGFELDPSLTGMDGLTLVAACSLRIPAPPDARAGLTVFADGVEVEYVDIENGRRRQLRVELPAGTSRLVLLVDDGGNGIAGDRVVLEQAAIVGLPADSHRDP